MNNFKESKLYNFYQNIINILMILILLFLFYLSLTTTNKISIDINEKIYFLKDDILINILSIIVFLLLLNTIRKNQRYLDFKNKINNDNKLFNRYKYILLFIIFSLSLIWVLATRVIPSDDPLFIFDGAYGLRINDYHMFEFKGYFAKFHHQLGLTYIYYFLSFIFGNYNYLAIQIINVICVTLFFNYLIKIMDLYKIKNISKLLLLLLGIFFIPLWAYACLTYGNIMGLTFALISIYYSLLFLDNKKVLNALLAAIFIFISLLAKQSYLIFLIAIIIHVILNIIKEKKFINSILIILLLLSFFCASRLPIIISKAITNEDLNEGISPVAYIAMGLQEGNSGPGWFNGYVDQLYTDSNFNHQRSYVEARINAVKSLKNYLLNPDEGLFFFIRKIASGWNEVSFQSLWINQVKEHNIELNNMTKYLLSFNGSNIIISYLDILHLLILFGSLAYFILKEKNNNILLPLIIIGGFIFHIFWEMKGQYVIIYFVLLLPYTIEGYNLIFNKLDDIKKVSFKEYLKLNKDYLIKKYLILLIVFIVINVLFMWSFNRIDPNYFNNEKLSYITYSNDFK